MSPLPRARVPLTTIVDRKSIRLRRAPMLIPLGTFKRTTRDIVLIPLIPDGKFEMHGFMLYKFF